MNDVEPTAKPRAIEKTRVLIGEGVEEVHFLSALLEHLEVSGVQVEHCGGKDGLGLYLRTLKTRPGFARVEKVGVVRDADEDGTRAAASVASFIAQATLPPEVAVSYHIVPADSSRGALENLCLASIAGQALETCIEDFLECASGATGVVHGTTTDKAKARVHAWLAVQSPPDLRLGIAASKGLVDWESPVFGELKDFLRSFA